MSILEGGNFDKFTVIKNEDIKKYLTDIQENELEGVLVTIENGRVGESKKANNTYLVINTDEPYAEEVIAILKQNGHWG
jgi:hypothetical protein